MLCTGPKEHLWRYCVSVGPKGTNISLHFIGVLWHLRSTDILYRCILFHPILAPPPSFSWWKKLRHCTMGYTDGDQLTVLDPQVDPPPHTLIPMDLSFLWWNHPLLTYLYEGNNKIILLLYIYIYIKQKSF